MRTSIALLLGVLPLTAGLVGCDTEEGRADKDVKKMLAEVDKANGPGRMTALTKAADYAGQSSVSKVHAKALVGDEELAAARVEAAAANVYAAQIGQLIANLRRMTDSIANASRISANLAKFEPTPAREAINKKIKELNEGEDGQWIAPLASISATSATIDELSKKIADGQAKIKELNDARTAALGEASRLESESNAAQGQPSVDLFKQASGKRKEALDLTSQADVATANLIPLKQDLAMAQAQQEMRASAVGRFEAQGKSVDEGWAQVQAAQAGLAEDAQAVVSGDEKTVGSLTKLAADLAKANDEFKNRVDEANKHFELAQAHYSSAATEADKFSKELAQRIGQKPDAPEAAAFKAMQNTFTVGSFNLKKARALQGQAILVARQAELLDAQSKAVDAIGPVLLAAAQQPPAGLVDAQSKEDAKTAVVKANEIFGSTVEILTTVSQAGAAGAGSAKDAKTAAAVELMLTEYVWSQFATATGDTAAAKTHLASAIEARSAAVEAQASFPALPAELALPKATAPTAPGAAPTTAPTASAVW